MFYMSFTENSLNYDALMFMEMQKYLFDVLNVNSTHFFMIIYSYFFVPRLINNKLHFPFYLKTHMISRIQYHYVQSSH